MEKTTQEPNNQNHTNTNQNNVQQTNTQQQQQQQQPQTKKKEIHISAATKDKAEAAKAYIERKYSMMIQEDKKNKEVWQLIFQKMQQMNINSLQQEQITKKIFSQETEFLRKKRQKCSIRDYDPLAIIGRGAFGEVRVCSHKKTSQIVAIKKMKKQDMLAKNQIGHIRAERDVLATLDNPWIVELKSSFQDDKYLYLVMEFLQGGDLMTMLMKKDILSEAEAKFYTAEVILAVESVHKMNYIHRDLKPDNVLITKDGHIKLSDFGLCKKTEIKPKITFGKQQNQEPDYNLNPTAILTKKPQNFKRNRQLAFSTVGTPDYIAPEVFTQNGYTETVDWWSVGVILFEMLVGYPPFFSDDPSMTCQKILHWKKVFGIPSEANLSQPAADLIRKLIADSNERLGINGVAEIKAHPFFYGIDWKKIRESKAPYIPIVKNEKDFTNFDKFKEEDPWIDQDQSKNQRIRKLDVNFIGYTFQRDVEKERPALVKALENLEDLRPSSPFQKQVMISPRNYQNENYDDNMGNLQKFSRPMSSRAINGNNNHANNNNNGVQIQYSFMKSTSPGRQQSPAINKQQNVQQQQNSSTHQQLQQSQQQGQQLQIQQLQQQLLNKNQNYLEQQINKGKGSPKANNNIYNIPSQNKLNLKSPGNAVSPNGTGNQIGVYHYGNLNLNHSNLQNSSSNNSLKKIPNFPNLGGNTQNTSPPKIFADLNNKNLRSQSPKLQLQNGNSNNITNKELNNSNGNGNNSQNFNQHKNNQGLNQSNNVLQQQNRNNK